jgi:hypothetical protein
VAGIGWWLQFGPRMSGTWVISVRLDLSVGPGAGSEELVEGDESGEVADRADEVGEGALADQLEQVGIAEPEVVGALHDLVGAVAAVKCDVAGGGVHGCVDGIGGLGSGTGRLRRPRPRFVVPFSERLG